MLNIVRYKIVWLVGALILFILAPLSAYAIEVKLISYHNFPPFVINDNAGLTFDLADYLSQRSDNTYQFKVTILPRKRLDNLLATNSDIVVPWVSQSWFDDSSATKFHWTLPLLSDGNVYISSIQNPIEVDTFAALSGKIVGGVLGHRYVGIDQLVAKGEFSRMNAPNEYSLVQMVARERLDVAVIANSAARYIVKDLNIENLIHFSEYNHSLYTRRILVSGYQPELASFLDRLSESIDQDPAWNELLKKYNLN